MDTKDTIYPLSELLWTKHVSEPILVILNKQRIILHMADVFVCIEYQILQKTDSSFLVGRPSKPGKGGSKPNKPKPMAMFDKFTKKKTGL